MNTAKLVSFKSAADRNAVSRNSFTTLGNAGTYRMTEPLAFEKYNRKTNEYEKRTTRYVWVSTSCVMGEWETYIFPAYSNGKVHDWSEMSGSRRHDFDLKDPHGVVFADMDCEVI
jgi:dTDP-D-glucose 4,6-dehydratase